MEIYYPRTWSEIIQEVLSLPCHQDLIVPTNHVANPIRAGFIESIGEPQGQIADYRKSLPSHKSIHVRRFDSYFRVHWDKRDPHTDLIGHLIEDAPMWGLIALICVAGLFFGLYTIFKSDKQKYRQS